MDRLRRLIREIHRRSIWQVLGIYVVGFWIAYQVVLNLVQGLGLPAWVPGFTIVLFIIGLPVVVATAIVQEAPPRLGFTGSGDETSGVPAAEERAESMPAAHRLLTWRNALLAGAIAFALLAGGAWLAVLLRPHDKTAAGASGGQRKAIAALPFQNMSGDPDDVYFTDGVHEEILTQLARIGGLRVVSRTSVMGYRGTTQNLKQIAQDLNVRYVLEGSVRRFEERVRITAQLIDAESDEHLWAETYDRPRSDLFAVQAEVAEQIADALQTTLTPEERAQINRQLTRSTEAHDLYMRAREYARLGDALAREPRHDAWKNAVATYGRAIAADPSFAAAWAGLSYQYARLHWYGYPPAGACPDSARAALERGRSIEAGLPEVILSKGYFHYWCERNYARAIDEYTSALRMLPGDPSIPALMGYIKRRQGQVSEAADYLGRSFEADPRNANLAEETGNTYRGARLWEKADQFLQKAIALAPDYPDGYIRRSDLYLGWRGDTRTARQILEDGARHVQTIELDLELYDVDMLEKRWQDAVRRLESKPALLETQSEVRPRDLLIGLALKAAGRAAEARARCAAALHELEQQNAAASSDHRMTRALALTFAALGRKTDALRTAERASTLLPMSLDTWLGGSVIEDRAQTFVLAGENKSALDDLELLLRTPSRSAVSPALLRIDQRWDPLRQEPRFQALLARTD